MRPEAARIPDRAALLVLAGSVATLIGFTAALFSDGGFAALIFTAGLGTTAVGMRQAEGAINDYPGACSAPSAPI
jgi:hypothetical protein